jgi:hypothetical protein
VDQLVDSGWIDSHLEQALANGGHSWRQLFSLRVEDPAHLNERIDGDDAPSECVGDPNMAFEDMRRVAILAQPLREGFPVGLGEDPIGVTCKPTRDD